MLTNDVGASILGGSGVEVENSGKTVINNGEIRGYHYQGIFVDTNTYNISITNDGSIFGPLTGIVVENVATIDNTGTGLINSDLYGIWFLGTTCTISNGLHATIEGSTYSIFTQVSGTLSLTNLGTLDGEVLCSAPTGNNSISNKGVVNGSVVFQSGDATFTDAGSGHVTGLIEGGTGADRFVAGRAKELFSAGTGADTFAFNSVKFSPMGREHDVIFNFSDAASDKIDMHRILAGGHHLVFIGTAPFAIYHSLHPGVIGMVRFSASNHQLQATVDGDFSAPDFAVSLPGLAALHADDLIVA
jgi:hypothetical protein